MLLKSLILCQDHSERGAMEQRFSGVSAGLRSGFSIAIGYVPAGITFGILAKNSGIPVADTLGFSGLVFAGASQYMAINLIVSGATTLQIVVATFLLNFRHFLMSATLSPRLSDHRPGVRAIIAFGITDETFAVASVAGSLSASYLATLNLTAWVSWFVGTILGFFAGSLLPPSIETAMGVALYALFAALIVPILKTSPIYVVTACAAAIIHASLLSFSPLSHGWSFVIAIAAASLGVAVISSFRRDAS